MKSTVLEFLKTWAPTSDRILVLPEEQQKESSGILLSGTKQGEDKRVIGTILAIGPGRYTEQGILVSTGFSVGQTVIFSKYVGEDLLVDESFTIEKYDGVRRDEQVLVTIVRADSLLSILPYAASA